MPSLRRVLVANRGEIAVRVMRTCRERDIETVAVYSDADRVAPHVLFADRAVRLGPPPARESYLDIGKVIAACQETGADAIHPGYGFLSENPDLAEACAAAGITLIGPPASAMRQMGSKTRARAAMTAAGVPVVPGDNGPDGRGFPDVAAALAAAERVGFPVLIKASAGGGGKGMRLVASRGEFAAAFEGARREAGSAFGDDAVYIERAVIRPRHVEIQVFADSHGNIVHLGERDCSIQRRHQKVIEEAPSPAPAMTADLRARMGKSAVAAAAACGYLGAGTCEFLLAEDGSYFFLEMNTRLQVEHPVTELCYGVDLVAWQLDVAEGKRLPMDQDTLDRTRRGAAIECRIYAEDSQRFLPSPGKITHLRVPNGPYVRDDSGVYEGSEISVHYDPMISKLVVWGIDRDAAIARMRRALDEYTVRGIKTNLLFHRRVMRHADFIAGRYDTGFIERERALCAPPQPDRESVDVAVAAAAIALAAAEPTLGVPGGDDRGGSVSPWRHGRPGWRSG